MKIAARWLLALQQWHDNLLCEPDHQRAPEKAHNSLHVATAAALLEHIVADTKTEIDGHSSWVGVSRYEYVDRGEMHNSVTYNTSRQCGPIALAPRAAWPVRPMCAGKPALANKRR